MFVVDGFWLTACFCFYFIDYGSIFIIYIDATIDMKISKFDMDILDFDMENILLNE